MRGIDNVQLSPWNGLTDEKRTKATLTTCSGEEPRGDRPHSEASVLPGVRKETGHKVARIHSLGEKRKNSVSKGSENNAFVGAFD